MRSVTPANFDTTPQTDYAWGKWFWVVIAFVVGALTLAWLLIPWQWSPVDDPGQVIAMRELFAVHNPVFAVLERMKTLAAGDLAGGVFRPLAWIYPPLLYWMPVVPAHVVRLLMVLLILIGPLAYFRRQGASRSRLMLILLLLLTAAGATYQGLILLSIQEVGGLALVSLGLLLPRPGLRLAAWTLAAWFKGPFSWILVGYAITLWRQGHRKLALTSFMLGISTLLVNAWWASIGSYTDRYQINVFDPELWRNASRLLEPFNGAIFLAALWWLVVTRSAPIIRSDFPIFAFAAIGYYVQLIPWGFTAYYMAPISFFLGLLVVSLLPDPDAKVRIFRLSMALSLPLVISIWVLGASLQWVIETNEVIRQASQCIATVPSSATEIVGNWLYLTTSGEGPIRLQQNIELTYPDWTGTIALGQSTRLGEISEGTSHLLIVSPIAPELGALGTRICGGDFVSLVELDLP